LSGAACTAAIARQSQAAPATFTIELTETSLTAPESLPGGIVSITFNNTGQVGQHLSLVRLREGVTPDKFQAALAENPGETISLVHLLSGSHLTPNASGQIVYDLKAGTHMALSFPDTEENSPPLTAVFQVSGQAAVGVAPQAKVKVELNDFAFVMPAQIKTGPQTWSIENTGQQWHELSIVKLTQDATVADVITAMSQEEEAQGLPPLEIAHLRQQEMFRQAEVERLYRQIKENRPGLRQQVGHRLLTIVQHFKVYLQSNPATPIWSEK
jgi:hypothetical protein